jgi:hypothetical protein
MDTILSENYPVARKRHWCEDCGNWILPKIKYFCQVQVVDNEMQTWRAHIDCTEAVREYRHMSGLWYDEYTTLRNDLMPEDHAWLVENYPEVAARLCVL